MKAQKAKKAQINRKLLNRNSIKDLIIKLEHLLSPKSQLDKRTKSRLRRHMH